MHVYMQQETFLSSLDWGDCCILSVVNGVNVVAFVIICCPATWTSHLFARMQSAWDEGEKKALGQKEEEIGSDALTLKCE